MPPAGPAGCPTVGGCSSTDVTDFRSVRARDLAPEDYARLLAFRTELRRFLRWSEQQAAGAGFTAAQHQLALAVRGLGGAPRITDLAEQLLLTHHAVVELVDRRKPLGTCGAHQTRRTRAWSASS
jgi:hypothetical protein